jgi:hypothetical protein
MRVSRYLQPVFLTLKPWVESQRPRLGRPAAGRCVADVGLLALTSITGAAAQRATAPADRGIGGRRDHPEHHRRGGAMLKPVAVDPSSSYPALPGAFPIDELLISRRPGDLQAPNRWSPGIEVLT